MTFKQISIGITNLVACLLWNVHQYGIDSERVGVAFGGGFSMLVSLAFISWVLGK